jgi:hypothetical protein
MADTVAITAGSGTTIATDDVGGVHYQQVKIVNGTLDSTTALIVNATGAVAVEPFVTLASIISERVPDTGGTSTAFSTFTATSAKRNYVTTIAVYNSSTTAGFVDFRDGTGGSVLFTVPVPAGGGAVVSFPVPLRQPTANTALAYDVSGALTTVYISLVGFQA